MLVDFSNRGPEDQSFLVGQLVAEREHAVQLISILVPVLLIQGTLTPEVQHIVFMNADSALIGLSQHSVEGLYKPQVYHEMKPFMQQPDPMMIEEYARLRGELGYHSPIPKMDQMVQQAIAKLTKPPE